MESIETIKSEIYTFPFNISPPALSLQKPLILEIHYASMPICSWTVSAAITYNEILQMVQSRYKLKSCILFVLRQSDYFPLTSDLLHIQGEDSCIQVYVAEAVNSDELQKKTLSFLVREAHSDIPESPLLERGHSASENISRSKNLANAALPLPMLFEKPANLTALRRMHKAMKKIENRGFLGAFQRKEIGELV